MSRGTFCLELQFWIFFHQFMILSQTFWDLVEFVWFLFSKMPSMSPQDLLKECFFLEKPLMCLSISNSERKRSVNWLGCFSRTVRIVFYVSKWTLRKKNFFKKKFFIIVFWTPIRNRADLVSIFSPALTELHLRVHRIVLRKTEDFWKGCIFPGV